VELRAELRRNLAERGEIGAGDWVACVGRSWWWRSVQRRPQEPALSWRFARRFAGPKGYREHERQEEAETIDRVREVHRERAGESIPASQKQLDLR
jgi:hypothetical protein